MRAPLIVMTMLGLSCFAYGIFLMIKNKPEFRQEVMKHLSADNQVMLNNLLQNGLDPTGQFAKLKSLENAMATCDGPPADGTSPADCDLKTSVNSSGTPPATEYNPTTANPADTLMEIQRLKQERKDALKELDKIN